MRRNRCGELVRKEQFRSRQFLGSQGFAAERNMQLRADNRELGSLMWLLY